MATTLQQQIDALEEKIVRVEQELQEAAENEKAALQQRLAALEQKSLLLMQQQAGATGAAAAAAGAADALQAMRFVPVIFVAVVTLAMGLWQLQRQGWKVPREDYPWTLAGVWGVVSAVKDSLKPEPPYKYVVTWPRWLAKKLTAPEGTLAVALFMMLYMGVVAGSLVLVMVYST